MDMEGAPTSGDGKKPKKKRLIRPHSLVTQVIAGLIILIAGIILTPLIAGWSQHPQTSASPPPSSDNVEGSHLAFVRPLENQHVGTQTDVAFEGSVPDGMNLWIFVRGTEGHYYGQGKAYKVGPVNLPGVFIGSSDKADNNKTYEIDAVLASTSEDSKMEKLVEQSHNDPVLSTLPGTLATKPRMVYRDEALVPSR